MSEETVQYYFRSGVFGAQVLWIKKRGRGRDTDCFGESGPLREYTIERKATPSEAASILPTLNAQWQRSVARMVRSESPG